MSRPMRVEYVALHRPDGDGQLWQTVCKIESIYPEVAAEECRKQAAAGIRDMVRDLCGIEPEGVEVIERTRTDD